MTKKTDDLTEAQRFALAEACRTAFLNGWSGRMTGPNNDPPVLWTIKGTRDALIRKGMVEENETMKYGRRGYRCELTAEGAKIGIAELERRGGDDPRETYKERKAKKDAKEAEDKARQKKVADLLQGLKIETGGANKTNLSASIRRGEFPRLDLENLEDILDFVAKK